MNISRMVLGFLALLPFEAFADYISEVLADAPIAYFRFEETSGTTAADSSLAGANHDATYVGTVALSASSANPTLGNAANFTPQSAVRIPDHTDFDLGTGDLAIEFWFKASVTNRGDLITYKGTGGDFGIHSSSQGAESLSIYHSGFKSTTASITANVWHHFVLSREAGTSTVYVDNVASPSFAHIQTFDITNDLFIGSNFATYPTLALGFTGKIDEVAFYNTALSAQRVASHFQAVPEPSVASLFGLGLFLSARRMRKNIHS